MQKLQEFLVSFETSGEPSQAKMQQNADETQIQIRLIQSANLCHDAEKNGGK